MTMEKPDRVRVMLLYTVIKTPKSLLQINDTVGAVKRPLTQMQPEKEKEK